MSLFLSPEDTVQCQAQSVRSLISCLTVHFLLADKGGGGDPAAIRQSASQTSSWSQFSESHEHFSKKADMD